MDSTQKELVQKYYQATHFDYKNLWTGEKDLTIHFGYYDDLAKKHKDAVMRLNAMLASYAKIKESDSVIDAGCGYGGSAMWLAENIGCSVTGITIVSFQAEMGMKSVQHRKLIQKVNLLVEDFSHTKFPNESFDVYWALESIVHADNRHNVLNEAFRLLKPNGRVVIAEYTYRESPILSNVEKQYMQPWLSGWAMPQLLTPSEYIQQLTKAGFKNIKRYDITKNVRPSLKRLKILCLLFLPGEKIIKFLKLFKKERIANFEGSLRQTKAFDSGLWQYSIFTAEK